MLEVRPLGLDGVLEIMPKRYGDDRGFFSETYNAAALFGGRHRPRFRPGQPLLFRCARACCAGCITRLPPRAQDKLVRVMRGAIFDVAVDIRRGSPTFGKWVGARAFRREVATRSWCPRASPTAS